MSMSGGTTSSENKVDPISTQIEHCMKKVILVVLVVAVIQWISFAVVLQRERSSYDATVTPLKLDLATYQQAQAELLEKEQYVAQLQNEIKERLKLFQENDRKLQLQKDLDGIHHRICHIGLEEMRISRSPKCEKRILVKTTELTTHEYIQLNLKNTIKEEDLDCFHETPFSGAILYLAPRKASTIRIHDSPVNRTDVLLTSLKRLHKYYNSLFHYPIFIFHEDYTMEDRARFRNEFGHPLHFVRVSFDTLPPCAQKPEEVQDWLERSSNTQGYRQMCRFWSGIVQNAPILSSFEYYIRLDDDTMIADWVNYDLFEYMSRYKRTYVYQRSFFDVGHATNLWSTAKQWLEETNRVTDTSAQWIKSGRYDGEAPYNNFHASRFDFWRSKEVGDLFQYVEDMECGFLRHGWGDANFHAIALNTLVDESRIVGIHQFPVQHNWDTSGIPIGWGKPGPFDQDAWAFLD